MRIPDAFHLLPVWVCALLFAGAGPPTARANPTVAVAVNADARAELAPCHCPGNPAGGLSRRSEVLKSLVVGTTPVVVLEGGDFVPGPDDTLRGPLGGLMVAAMALMPYDAIGPGENELFLGPDSLAAMATRLPLVCANLAGSPAVDAAVPALRRFERGGVSVAVTAVVDPLLYYQNPDVFSGPLAELTVLDPVEALTELAPELRQADLVVVIAHAPLDRVLEFGEALDFVDVFAQGHEPDLAARPGRAGRAWVVEPGPRSRQVVAAFFHPGEAGVWDFDRQDVHELKRTVRFDDRIEGMVQAFAAEHGER